MTAISEPRNIPRGITLIPPGSQEFGDLVAAMGLPTATPGRAALLQYDLRHRILRWILLLPSAAMLLSAFAVVSEMRMEWWLMLISVGAVLWILLLCLWLFNRWGKDVRWYLLEPNRLVYRHLTLVGLDYRVEAIPRAEVEEIRLITTLERGRRCYHVQAVLPSGERVRLVSDEGDKAKAEWFREFMAAWLSLP